MEPSRHHPGSRRTLGIALALSLTLSLVPGAAGAAAAPALVSPGAPETVTTEEGVCPTFSWTLAPEATAYELVVYRLRRSAGGAPPEEAPPALEERLPAGATAWTPPLGRCLERGERYAWFLRAEFDGAPGPWSEGSLFAIAPAEAVEEAGRQRLGRGRPSPSGGWERDRGRGGQSAGGAAVAGAAEPAAEAAAPAEDGVAETAAVPALFHVTGGVRITGEYAFDQPRQVRRLYSASQFQLQKRVHEDELWLLSDVDYGSFLDGTGSLDVELVLPLDDLPPEAVIQELTCRFLDNTAVPGSDANLSASFRLRRRGRRATEPSTLATVAIATTGSSSLIQAATDTTIDEPVVGDDQVYWIDGTFEADAAAIDLRFYGCELVYEIDHVGPLARLLE